MATMKMVLVDGTDQVLVIHRAASCHAVQGICSHEYFELDKGFLTNGTLTCALHLSRFDLRDGEPLDPPAEAAAGRLPGRRGGRAASSSRSRTVRWRSASRTGRLRAPRQDLELDVPRRL